MYLLIKQQFRFTYIFLKTNFYNKKSNNNTNQLNNAPEQVVASEKKKQADAESKIKVLEEKLASLS